MLRRKSPNLMLVDSGKLRVEDRQELHELTRIPLSFQAPPPLKLVDAALRGLLSPALSSKGGEGDRIGNSFDKSPNSMAVPPSLGKRECLKNIFWFNLV